MAIRSASDSIKQLIDLSDALDKVAKTDEDLTHIFVKAQSFEAKPTGLGKLWHGLKRLFLKDSYSIEKNLASFQREFSNANSVTEEEYSALQERYGDIEGRLNHLADRLEVIKNHVIYKRNFKNVEPLQTLTIPHIDIEERRIDAFEEKLKKKAEELLRDPNADYAQVLTEFSSYANKAIPPGSTREQVNKNFAPKITALQNELQEAIRAFVLGSLELLDAMTPYERTKQIALLRSIIVSARDMELHNDFEKAIERSTPTATTTVEKTTQIAATIPLFTADNAYKTLGYIAYDLGTKGPHEMLSMGYLLGLAAPTVALHLYNKMVTAIPDISSKKSFVICYLTQILAKSGAPYVTHQFKKLLG